VPLYEFECDECKKVFEQFYKMDECPVWMDCPDRDCEGAAKKVLPSSYGVMGDHPTWLNDHVREVLQRDGERPIETRKEHDQYLKENGYVQRG